MVTSDAVIRGSGPDYINQAATKADLEKLRREFYNRSAASSTIDLLGHNQHSLYCRWNDLQIQKLKDKVFRLMLIILLLAVSQGALWVVLAYG